MKHPLFYFLALTWLCASCLCQNGETPCCKKAMEEAITSLSGTYEGSLRVFQESTSEKDTTLQSHLVTATRELRLSVPIEALRRILEQSQPDLAQQLPHGTTVDISAPYAEFLKIDCRHKRFVLAPQTSTISFLDASNRKHTLQLLYSKAYGGNADGEFIMFNALIERMVYDGKEVTPYKPIQIHFEGNKKK